MQSNDLYSNALHEQYQSPSQQPDANEENKQADTANPKRDKEIEENSPLMFNVNNSQISNINGVEQSQFIESEDKEILGDKQNDQE